MLKLYVKRQDGAPDTLIACEEAFIAGIKEDGSPARYSYMSVDNICTVIPERLANTLANFLNSDGESEEDAKEFLELAMDYVVAMLSKNENNIRSAQNAIDTFMYGGPGM